VSVWRSIVLFAAFAAVLTVTPGPDTALVIRNTLRAGRRSGIVTAAGICSGLLVWSTLAGLGVTGLLAVSRRAYDVLRLAGAAYLIYLGVRSLFGKGPKDDGEEEPFSSGRGRGMVSFNTGVLSNLLNPKVGVFYITVLPQFIPPEGNVLPLTLLLGAIHAVEGVIWLTAIAWAVTRAGRFVRQPRIRRRLEAVTGLVLIGFGLRVAFDRR
jgi:RhtB (resistance to homoserine/threonine) family protein